MYGFVLISILLTLLIKSTKDPEINVRMILTKEMVLAIAVVLGIYACLR